MTGAPPLSNSVGAPGDDWQTHPDGISGRGMRLFDPVRVESEMAAAGIDLLLPHTVVNGAYFSDYYFYDFGPFYATEGGLPYLGFVGIAVDPATHPFLVAHTGGNAMDLGDQEPWIKDRYLFGDSEPRSLRVDPARSDRPVSPTAVDAVTRALLDRGLELATVGLEMRFLGATVVDALRVAMPGATFVDGTPTMERCRLIKSGEEIRRLRVCAEGSRAIHAAVNRQLGAGMTGHDVDRLIKLAAADQNLDIEFREIHPNRENVLRFAPGGPAIRPGESIVIDVGTRYLSYVSDMAHNHSVGEPEPAVRRLHDRVRVVFEELMGRAGPGVACAELGSHGLARLAELDVPMAYGLVGHGLGRGLHEHPILAPSSVETLEPGMVIALEIPVFAPGVAAVQIEEDFLVTESGIDWLAPSDLGILVA